MPTWLIEGFADYVGNLGSGQPVPAIAAELAAEVRRGPAAGRAADRRRLRRRQRRLPQAYEQSWLACRLIADRIGPARPGAVLPDGGRGRRAPTRPPRVATGLRPGAAHRAWPRFTAGWRAYLLRASCDEPRAGCCWSPTTSRRGRAASRSFVYELARRLPAGPDRRVRLDLSRVRPSSTPSMDFPVRRHPTGLLVPTPAARRRVLQARQDFGGDRGLVRGGRAARAAGAGRCARPERSGWWPPRTATRSAGRCCPAPGRRCAGSPTRSTC